MIDARVVVLSLADGIIAGAGVVLGAMGQAGTFAMPSAAAWLAAGLTGLVAAALNVKSLLSLPPR